MWQGEIRIGEFGKSNVIRQYFTYTNTFLPTYVVSLLLNPNSPPNISLPILGDKPIRQYVFSPTA